MKKRAYSFRIANFKLIKALGICHLFVKIGTNFVYRKVVYNF